MIKSAIAVVFASAVVFSSAYANKITINMSNPGGGFKGEVHLHGALTSDRTVTSKGCTGTGYPAATYICFYKYPTQQSVSFEPAKLNSYKNATSAVVPLVFYPVKSDGSYIGSETLTLNLRVSTDRYGNIKKIFQPNGGACISEVLNMTIGSKGGMKYLGCGSN